jgi:hypothetical protein
MSELEFSDQQKSVIGGLFEAFNSETLFCLPAINKKDGEIDSVLVILDDEDETFIPIGIMIRPGEEIFDQFDFQLDFDEKCEHHKNIVFDKPSTWERIKSFFK